jgi:hypothetical protein
MISLVNAGSLRDDAPPPKTKGEPPKDAKDKGGLLLNDPRACPGYTLLAPTTSKHTYLMDLQGRVVRKWESDCNPGQSTYFLDNGNLLRAGQLSNPPFFTPGYGGRIQEFTWDGQIVWDFKYVSQTQLPHHDICRLPNGNILMIVWEKKPAKEAIAAGRRPETVGDGDLLADSLLEVQPTGKTTGKIVWEWHAWDHLIQDFDPAKTNYGDVGVHPERIDLNFGEGTIAAMVAKPEELKKLQSIGYVGGAGRKPQRVQPDWTHTNAIAYNAELDQILLSVHEFSEIWIIDHSTTTAESASHAGGRYGKGGDLLYRWGNPRAYRAGTIKDQKLFSQHNAQWIARGLPGEGNILVFNNGLRRTGGAHSTVDEIVPPVDAKGHYAYTAGQAFGPDKPVWTYVAPKRTDFYSAIISGAQRLPNGNTLICSGTNGTIFEVTPEKETVWKYVNPVKGSFNFPQFGGPPPLGQILASFLQDMMKLTAEQKKELQTAEKQLAEKLDKLLTAEQKKQLKERPAAGGPAAFASMPPPGQLLSSSIKDQLKLTAEQKKQLGELQKEADSTLAKILKEEQKKQLKEVQDGARAFTGGPPPGGGPALIGRPPGGFGPLGANALFRATRYPRNYPGLTGKDLTPGKTVEELQPKDSPKEPKEKQAQ